MKSAIIEEISDEDVIENVIYDTPKRMQRTKSIINSDQCNSSDEDLYDKFNVK